MARYRDYLATCGEQFDAIVGLDIIEHPTRDEAFELLDLCRAAPRPGALFLTTPNGAALRPGPIRYGDLTHETIFTPGTIAMALRLTGFEAIEVREIAPPPTSLRSRVRKALWSAIRLWPMFLDLVETGGRAGRIYSRNMAVVARKSS